MASSRASRIWTSRSPSCSPSDSLCLPSLSLTDNVQGCQLARVPRALNNLAGLAFLDLAQNSIRWSPHSDAILEQVSHQKAQEPWQRGAEQPWVDHGVEPGEKCDPGAGAGGLLRDQRHPLQPQPAQQPAHQLPHRGHHQSAGAEGEGPTSHAASVGLISVVVSVLLKGIDVEVMASKSKSLCWCLLRVEGMRVRLGCYRRWPRPT